MGVPQVADSNGSQYWPSCSPRHLISQLLLPSASFSIIRSLYHITVTLRFHSAFDDLGSRSGNIHLIAQANIQKRLLNPSHAL
jgi:hypothetical protein